MLRLVARHGEETLHFSVPEGECVLGSSEDAAIRIPFAGVSRRHATLSAVPGGIRLVDAGSKNGLVRDGAVVHEVVLFPGIVVQIGRALFTVEEISSADDEVALLLGPYPSPSLPSGSPRRRSEEETSSLTPGDDRGPASDALRLIRRMEADGSHTERKLLDHVSSLRDLLDAAGLFLGEVSGEAEVSVRTLSGSLPSSGVLDGLARFAFSQGTAETVHLERAGGLPVLVAAGPGRDRRTLLAAVFPLPSAVPAPWQRELFGYVAQKLIASLSMEVAVLAPSAPAPSLVIPPGMVVGGSSAMQALLAQVRATVRSGMDVLLTGETGTGKELFARMIHASGLHPEGPFVAINCAAIPAELLEAELFGVQKGVATGVDPRPGRFQQADGGTIFLDEVSELADHLQAKLLRVLQEHEILPLGASAPRKISARVVSATNQELDERVKKGRFRADLFYRLRGLQFHIPPLRDRKDDIPELVVAFAMRFEQESDKRIRGVNRRALDLLLAHDWPGNVRELENDVRRAVLTCHDGGVLEPSHFGPVRWVVEPWKDRPEAYAAEGQSGQPGQVVQAGQGTPPSAAARAADGTSPAPERLPSTSRMRAVRPLHEVRDEAEKKAIELALEKTRGNKSLAARLLDISRNGLAARMRELGLLGRSG